MKELLRHMLPRLVGSLEFSGGMCLAINEQIGILTEELIKAIEIEEDTNAECFQEHFLC